MAFVTGTLKKRFKYAFSFVGRLVSCYGQPDGLSRVGPVHDCYSNIMPSSSGLGLVSDKINRLDIFLRSQVNPLHKEGICNNQSKKQSI
jgi:hypothetical protein